jgi:hypothetical protein
MANVENRDGSSNDVVEYSVRIATKRYDANVRALLDPGRTFGEFGNLHHNGANSGFELGSDLLTENSAAIREGFTKIVDRAPDI